MNVKDKDGIVRDKIFNLIETKGHATPNIIAKEFDISLSMVHRHLLKLQNENKIVKSGKAPKVFYSASKTKLKSKPKANPKDEVELIARIARPIFKKYGIKKAQIFGSASRGEMTKNSDIDFLVELGKPLGYEFVGLAFALEDALERKVDLVTPASLSQFIKPYIQPDLKIIYER